MNFITSVTYDMEEKCFYTNRRKGKGRRFAYGGNVFVLENLSDKLLKNDDSVRFMNSDELKEALVIKDKFIKFLLEKCCIWSSYKREYNSNGDYYEFYEKRIFNNVCIVLEPIEENKLEIVGITLSPSGNNWINDFNGRTDAKTGFIRNLILRQESDRINKPLLGDLILEKPDKKVRAYPFLFKDTEILNKRVDDLFLYHYKNTALSLWHNIDENCVDFIYDERKRL